MIDAKICPRCAKLYSPCEPWRAGCTACGNLLKWATPNMVVVAVANRKREGWIGDCRTRDRVAL